MLIDKNALPASLTMFLFLIPYGAISTFIALYAVEINIANGGIFFTRMAVTTVLTRGLSGRTVDKVGERPIVIVSVVAVSYTHLYTMPRSIVISSLGRPIILLT